MVQGEELIQLQVHVPPHAARALASAGWVACGRAMTRGVRGVGCALVMRHVARLARTRAEPCAGDAKRARTCTRTAHSHACTRDKAAPRQGGQTRRGLLQRLPRPPQESVFPCGCPQPTDQLPDHPTGQTPNHLWQLQQAGAVGLVADLAHVPHDVAQPAQPVVDERVGQQELERHAQQRAARKVRHLGLERAAQRKHARAGKAWKREGGGSCRGGKERG